MRLSGIGLVRGGILAAGILAAGCGSDPTLYSLPIDAGSEATVPADGGMDGTTADAEPARDAIADAPNVPAD